VAALGAAGGVPASCGLAATSATAAVAPPPDPVRRGRPLVFPRDHGAHPGARIEWWYVTGFCGPFAAPTHGVQVTFFRSATGLAGPGMPGAASRFAPRQLLFAHAAVTDLARAEHHHADRAARWNGDPAAAAAAAALDTTRVHLARWRLDREGEGHDRLTARITGERLAFTMQLRRTQPLLLQGDAGFSRKGPLEAQASHYYSEPQLALELALDRAGGRPAQRLAGRAWLDHEWSDELMPPEAVGWDWIGIHLEGGGALTAFRLRAADGRSVWAGGSVRAGPAAAATAFDDAGVRWTPVRTWASPATGARYPVQWRVATPAGTFGIRALLDAQELDSRGSTGTVYWEGIAEATDDAGRRVGVGYLEMTGYTSRLTLG
jgi:predicted secreted hydrolase